MPKFNFSTKNMVRIALVAALYAVMTIMIPGLSYGPVQFRFAELLVLMCFYRKDYCVSMILGCFIANCFSPMALMDMVFGTLATAIAVLPMYHIKNIWLASLLPAVSNGVIIGIELFIAFGEPLAMSMLTVAIGELVVITIIGCPLFSFVLQRSKPFMSVIGSDKFVAKTENLLQKQNK